MPRIQKGRTFVGEQNQSPIYSRPHSVPQSPVTLPAFMPSHNGCNTTHPFALGAHAEILPQRGPLLSTGIIPLALHLLGITHVVRRNEQASRQCFSELLSSINPRSLRQHTLRCIKGQDICRGDPTTTNNTRKFYPREAEILAGQSRDFTLGKIVGI